MHIRTHTAGQSLLEMVFAIALFVLGIVTIAILLVDAYGSLQSNTHTYQASLRAKEGIAAVRALGASDFDAIPTGTYGLEMVDGKWVLSATPDTDGVFTRTITIADIDEETKQIESEVVIAMRGPRLQRAKLIGYVSDWAATGGEAGSLAIDTEGVHRTASGTDLVGVTLQNTSGSAITITGMTVTFDTPVTLDQIVLDGAPIFLAATSSGATSGTYIDTVDYLLGAYSDVRSLDHLIWSSAETGSDVIITFILGDGSRRHVLITP